MDLLHVTIMQLPITSSRRLLRHLVAREMAKGREARGGRVLLNESIRKWRIALTVHTQSGGVKLSPPSVQNCNGRLNQSPKTHVLTSSPAQIAADLTGCETRSGTEHTHTRVEIEMGDSCWNRKSRILTAVPSEGDR